MKILVTGGTGKIGQYVVRELLRNDRGKSAHEVIVFDRVPGPESSIVKSSAMFRISDRFLRLWWAVTPSFI